MKFITSKQFKELDKKKHDTTPKLVKAVYSGVEITGEREITFVISSGSVDRDNDKIPVKAWNFDDFMKNPVVLWSHKSDELPIGKCIAKPIIEGNTVKATVEFPAPGLLPQADTIFEMCKNGFLNATSVGFESDDWDYTTDPARGGDTWKPGINFKSVSLMEFSIVSIPANPEALIQHDYAIDQQKTIDHINNQTNKVQARERAKRILRFLELG